ncbi:MAG: RHS repeat-associated core domain-containing protein [Polyangiaceae bacterium]
MHHVLAPPNDLTVSTTVFSTLAYLYTGPDRIQFGVAPGTLQVASAAGVFGHVVLDNGDPAMLAEVRVLDHPEFGSTIVDAHGDFRMVVNGGGPLTVYVTYPGYLESQRTVTAPWNDYVHASDMMLVARDPISTPIELNAAEFQVAQGSVQTDGKGTRRATVLVPPGTNGTMHFADGSSAPLIDMHVRATEFTVGPNGRRRMPAELPVTTAYTYAVEINADEAVAAGAREVTFDQTLSLYVDNYYGFAVGSDIPKGTYDRDRGTWVAEADGVVLEIVSAPGGIANIDITGDGVAESQAALDAIGLSPLEREELASIYPVGKRLWRMPINHFTTPYDCNMRSAPGCGSAPCTPQQVVASLFTPTCDGCEQNGSVIECDNGIVGERIGVPGTGVTLTHFSDRAAGYNETRRVHVSFGTENAPATLVGAEIVVAVAGKRYTSVITCPCAPDAATDITWDGRDDQGRIVQGSVTANISLTHFFPPVMTISSGGGGGGGGSFGSAPAMIAGAPEYDPILALSAPDAFPYLFAFTQTTTRKFYNWDARAFGLGGWTVSGHDAYDTTGGFLRRGDGTRRTTETLPPIALKVADAHAIAVASAPDGTRWFSTTAGIFHQASDGTTTQITGGPSCTFGVDNVPAIQLCAAPRQLVFGPDENLYFADDRQVHRIDKDGFVHPVAGRRPSLDNDSGDGGLAVNANFRLIQAIAVGDDGNVYIATDLHHIKRVATNGYMYAFAGNGSNFPSGDGGPAQLASFGLITSMSVGPDQSLYVADFDASRVRRIRPAGTVETYAGGGLDESGNGVDRLAAQLIGLDEVAVARDGTLYVSVRQVLGWNATSRSVALRVIEPNGRVRTVAGTGDPSCPSAFAGACGNMAPATKLNIPSAMRLAFGPAGDVLATDGSANRLLSIRDPLPNLLGTAINIPEEDGETLLSFDTFGRHLRTVDATTATELEHFTYDAEGYLTAITDRDGLAVTIERDANHRGTAIVGPYGHRTELTIDGNDDLTRVREPTGAEWNISYANGLITEFRNPNNHTSTLSYDGVGRLIADHDAGGSGYDLTRTGTPDAWTSTLTSAMGRGTSHANATLPTGLRTRDITGPDTLVTHWTMDPTERFSIALPSGVFETVTRDPDPRFGMFSPLATGSVRQPSGLTQSFSERRSLTFNSAGSILDVRMKTDTIVVNGRTATIAYDANHDVEVTTTPAGRTFTRRFDDVGHLTEVDVPEVLSVSVGYDAQGRVIVRTQGTRTTAYTYGADGMVASVTDPLGQTTAFERDANGRVITTTRPDLAQITVAYDPLGHVSQVTPPGKPVHAFAFNSRELVSEYDPPNAATGPTATTYAYNLDKQLTDHAQPGPRNLHVEYDGAGRPTGITFPTGSITTGYDGSGRVATLSGPTSETLTFSYDGSLVKGVTLAGQVSGTLGYTYDSDFRLTSDVVNGSGVAFTYDADSLLLSAGAMTLARSAQNGRVTGTTLGGVSDTVGYSLYGEVSAYAAQHGSAPLLSFTYARDDLGRISQQTETVLGVARTLAYTYDNLGRLKSVTEDGDLVESYVYDLNGNRTSSLNSAGVFNGTYDGQDRMGTYGDTAFTYAENGELAYKIDPTTGTTAYTYDALGNLRSVVLPTGTQIDYLVDAEGRRVGKKVNGALTQAWLWRSALQPVAELDAAGNVVARFVYAGGANVPAYMITAGGATYRILTDHLGSVRLVVDVATGAVAQKLTYDSWGRVLEDTNPGFQPFGFAGGLYDADTGLVRFGARDYDAETGRWTARDPIGLQGGVNVYQYAGANPGGDSDPSGLLADGPATDRFLARALGARPIYGVVHGSNMTIEVPQFGRNWTLAVSSWIDAFGVGARKERDALLVHAHGTKHTIDVGDTPGDANQIATLVAADSDYHGQTIQLDACNTGIEGGIGQTLSRLLNVRLIAPTGYVDWRGNVTGITGEHAWNVYENGELVGWYD